MFKEPIKTILISLTVKEHKFIKTKAKEKGTTIQNMVKLYLRKGIEVVEGITDEEAYSS